MPHVIVKMFPGPSEVAKSQLAQKIVDAVTEAFQLGDESVSVAMEEVSAKDWSRRVYDRDIQPNMDQLYKKPGYARF